MWKRGVRTGGEWRSVHKESRYVRLLQKREVTSPLSFSLETLSLSIFVLRFRKACLVEILFELLHVHKKVTWKELEREREEVTVYPLNHFASTVSPKSGTPCATFQFQ